MVLNIKAIQEITLLDYPDKIASTIFFGGCNFKCPSCHNPGLVFNEGGVLTEKEILDELEKRKKFIQGVCLTGGEPLLSDLEQLKKFIREIKQKKLSVKLDTNGSFPEKLKSLIDSGLIDYIAMDVKSPADLYSKVAGVKVDIDKIKESIKIISESGVDYEFRTTISPIINEKNIRWMNVEEVEEIGKLIVEITGKNQHKYYLQKFVPRQQGLIDKRLEDFSETSVELLKEIKRKVEKYLPQSKIR
ncbi:anaerobic ribonucleoside-triphosphate reductase activating protein [Candidatus Pacearchaeota archaeon]|nr:anaerobic ribonucleoside-triphosphate reductase activating protein [Candidatus Pacearchaeota archaeon]